MFNNAMKSSAGVHKILVVNPGSTSTKIAFGDEAKVETVAFRHTSEELARFASVWDQFEHRLGLCRDWAKEHVKQCSAVVTLGGLLKPVQGGTYTINGQMIQDARANMQGEHASNLGCAIAKELAIRYNVPAFAVDPISVDEFEQLAYYSGHPLIRRRSLSHALNIHAAARRAARELSLSFGQSNIIIAHIGGGISIAPVRGRKIIDVNDAASDGPFSAERTGGLPLQSFIELCYSGKYSRQEMSRLVMGNGGLVAYLGTNSLVETEQRIDKGDTTAKEVFTAMAYQIAKEIGAMSTVLNGKVDAIVLTGGAANSKRLTEMITERVKFIANVLVYPGENEMQALADAASRVLRGEEIVGEY